MITPDPVGPGQVSVWSFPRPAVAEACTRRVRIIHGGRTLADTVRSVRTLETSHPPSYYIPQADIDMTLLQENSRTSFCEWKGAAVYYDVHWPVAMGGVMRSVGWSYPNPSADFMSLQDHVAFYAGPFEACLVDEHRVVPQAGSFYGGWITPDVAGPFKGAAGSTFW